MRGNKALAIAMWIGILVLVLVTRNRIQILPLLVGIIALVLFRLERITIKHVVLAVVAAVLVILIVYGLRAFRYYGTLQNFFETFRLEDFIEQIAIFFRTDNGELGLRQWFYYFIEHDNDFNAFGEGNTYWRMALVFVPTQFSFGLKPDDFAQAMGAAVGWPQEAVCIPPFSATALPIWDGAAYSLELSGHFTQQQRIWWC